MSSVPHPSSFAMSRGRRAVFPVLLILVVVALGVGGCSLGARRPSSGPRAGKTATQTTRPAAPATSAVVVPATQPPAPAPSAAVAPAMPTPGAAGEATAYPAPSTAPAGRIVANPAAATATALALAGSPVAPGSQAGEPSTAATANPQAPQPAVTEPPTGSAAATATAMAAAGQPVAPAQPPAANTREISEAQATNAFAQSLKDMGITPAGLVIKFADQKMRASAQSLDAGMFKLSQFNVAGTFVPDKGKLHFVLQESPSGFAFTRYIVPQIDKTMAGLVSDLYVTGAEIQPGKLVVMGTKR